MTNQQDLKNASEEIEHEREALETSRDGERASKIFFKAGLVGLAYLGVRSLIGPELDLYAKEIHSTLQAIDVNAAVYSFLGVVAGGIGYGLSYLSRKENERDLKNAESELENLTEDYNFSRGHI
jgi:hypothetical protein